MESILHFKKEIDGSLKEIFAASQMFEEGNGEHSVVQVGGENVAYGMHSIALGESTRARADMSFTFGNHTESTNFNEVSFGTYNNSQPGTKFSVGDGDSNQNRKNMMMIDSSGQMYLRGVGGYQGNENDLSNIQSVNEVVNNCLTLDTQITVKGRKKTLQEWLEALADITIDEEEPVE